MPSLLDYRGRIRGVKSTQQITKAMKMVAASKLRRSQDRILHARPFARQMLRVLNSLASRVPAAAHPLLTHPEPRADGRVLLIVISSDRGLCGSFNTNIIKSAGGFVVADPAREVVLGLIGRKSRDFFARRGFDVRFEHVNFFSRLRYEDGQAIARAAIEEFATGAVMAVYVIYNEFKLVLAQRIVVERLLPIPRLQDEEEEDEEAALELPVDYLYEPAPAQIFDELLPRHVDVQVFRALLESAAAEQAARMTAMDAATKNAGEMIDHLTLEMNKVRQAAITREIIEVMSGAGAL